MQRLEPRTNTLFEQTMARYPRSMVQPDDILDALVALVTGRASNDELKCMPAKPERDKRGMPMRMMYRVPG